MLAIFSATIFLSAGLLFAVQPLFTKIVLPYLGGAPSVWSVAMVFFQAMLLAGYFYAHLLTKHLPGMRSVAIHLAVMVAATLFLPLSMAQGWGRPPAMGAEFWLIGLFLVSIGLPFFALSANAPLLQAWFARTGHPSAKDPYFLYAASNIGSFLALLGYPLLAEPLTRLGQQTQAWTYLFYVLIVLIAASGFILLRSRNMPPAVSRDVAGRAPTWRDALIWVVLAAVPSAFLVAVTAHISTDVASSPLLWVVPLSLYLLTFVIVFQTKRILPHSWFIAAQPYAILLLISLMVFDELSHIGLMILINVLAFFITAMVCHGELASRRPAATYLTNFYLWMSVGGMIGGISAGLIAPNVFNWVIEYPILMIAGLLCRPGLRWPREWREWSVLAVVALLLGVALLGILKLGIWPRIVAFNGMVGILLLLGALYFRHQPFRLAVTYACALVLIYAYHWEGSGQTNVRSFFGVNKVYENSNGQFRILMHGTTIHGVQRIRNPDGSPVTGRPDTISYFSSRSPMAITFEATKQNRRGPVKVAVVGLGIGTVACYLRPEDTLDFFEIDQAVVKIATDPSQFTMISSCKPNSRIVVGDARLTLEDSPDGFYDLIVMDAFTSDAVPVHLMTREAMALYLKKLAPGGMVVAHVMNRHMELASVVAGVAAANNAVTRVMQAFEINEPGSYIYGSSVAAVARNDRDFGRLLDLGNWELEPPDPRQWVWTDDYSNIVGAMLRHYRQ